LRPHGGLKNPLTGFATTVRERRMRRSPNPVSGFAPSRWFEKPTHRVCNHCEGAGEAREWLYDLTVVCGWQQTKPTHRPRITWANFFSLICTQSHRSMSGARIYDGPPTKLTNSRWHGNISKFVGPESKNIRQSASQMLPLKVLVLKEYQTF
jgi:hypothetical protein